MISQMDSGNVVAFFRGRSILITGSTGFLGKVLVEKILRVQPDVKKLYLLVRANDVESATRRVQDEVTGKEIFQVLKEKHGDGFESFVEEKVCTLAGDIIYENLGLDSAKLTELSNEIDIIVNGAATTNFYERYDVAFDSNVLGAKNICEFAKKCTKLKMLLHVSTAYVAGEQEGLILEKPFLMGQALREGRHLDITSELNLIKETRREMKASNRCSEKTEKRTMKELGLKRAKHFGWPNTYVFTKAMGEMLLGHLRGDLPVVIIRPSIITSILKEPLPGWMEGIRTIDSVIIGYAKQTLSFFLVDLNLIMDVIPGDMVVNAMMVAMAAHSGEQAQTIYHVTSSLSNPAPYAVLSDAGHRYFFANPPPRAGKNGRLRRMRFFSTVASFRAHMAINYKLPLEDYQIKQVAYTDSFVKRDGVQILRLVNIALCGMFSRRYDELSRKYKFVMHLVELYAPYTLFKGCFDDINTEKLRITMRKQEDKNDGGYCFDFDPKSIDWDEYFYKVHIPGVVKYLCD
uniref:Fatty acyl-CoA reductase n=2 Tax=Oryza sativa subsp. japonica TaxID=39947 RepID=Q69QW2_ORYSJ|nr:putative fatty acyl coA reductase [Oryza sativa Japonica Group]BAD31814.1 putative fatty acyl coA reductase [Oryza sativa Japonica Group]